MILSKDTLALLEDIERRIDPDAEEEQKALWHDFLYGGFEGEIFSPRRPSPSPSTLAQEKININDALDSLDLMIRLEMQGVSRVLESGVGVLGVRANYGTGILPSLFGAKIFKMPRETDTLPTTVAIGEEGMRRIVSEGIPSLTKGFGQAVFDFGEACLEIFSRYPKIQKYVDVFHPDTQGPLDICDLLWGSDIFYALYDDPDFVHEALTLITDTFIALTDKWHELYPIRPDMNSHWRNLWHRGGVLLRSDSAMNISPDLYREFSMPYDARLLERYGGGCIHFCGRGDHYIELLSTLPSVYAINMSQPSYNDMETIYRHTVDKGIRILSFDRRQAEQDKARGFRHCIHT